MLEAVIITVLVTIAGIGMFGLLPWAAQKGAASMLLMLREDLYDLAVEHPGLRSLAQYRDTEYVLCLAIRNVRDQSAWIGLRFLVDVLGTAQDADANTQHRAEVYQSELASRPELEEAVEEMRFLIQAALGAMLLRIALGSGPLVAITLAIFPAYMLGLCVAFVAQRFKELTTVPAPAVVVLAAVLLVPFGVNARTVSKAAGSRVLVEAGA